MNKDDILTEIMGRSEYYVMNGTSKYSTHGSVNGSIGVDISTTHASPGIVIKDGGDLVIGEQSLKKFMADVKERLAIFDIRPELEKEFEDLRVIGEAYAKKVEEIQ